MSRPHKRKMIIGILVFVSFLCFLLSYLSMKRSNIVNGSQTLISAPRTTGRLVWYTSIPQRHAERITNAFNLEYGIKVDIVRSSTFIIRERLFSEIKANTVKADVLTIADLGTYVELENKDLLLNYTSRYYPNYPEAFNKSNTWGVFAGFGICMAYNKERIKTPPKQWTDLLDPKWKGRIGLEDINTAGSQYGQYYMLRKELGKAFWEKLLRIQRPKIYYKTEALANALLEGEIDVAGEFSIHTVYEYKIKRNTPIEGIYPSQGTPFIINPVAILKRTSHMTESKQFFDYLLSEEGQTIMQELNFKYSVRKGMPSLHGIPAFKDLNVLLPEKETDYLRKRQQYIEEYNSFYSERAIKNENGQLE